MGEGHEAVIGLYDSPTQRLTVMLVAAVTAAQMARGDALTDELCTASPRTNAYYKTRKPRKGAAVIAARMHGFADCRKFKRPVTSTKVTSTYTVRAGLQRAQPCDCSITQY